MRVETDIDLDGRWIADISHLPGVMAYGRTREEAMRAAEALACRVIAERLDQGEPVPEASEIFAVQA